MALNDNDQDTRYALSKLLQRGTVTEYETPTTLEEAFSIARITEARFETIAGKKLNTEEKIDIVISCPSEEAPPEIKGSLDVNEDIGVVQVSSVIDDVFDIEVVVGGGEACGVGEDELNRVISALKDGGGEFDGRLVEINLNLSEELADNEWKAEEKKGVGCGSRRQENYGSGRRNCGRIRIWDPGIKRIFKTSL
nr:hypothetical protein [Tanacetum cinerariifolium]